MSTQEIPILNLQWAREVPNSGIYALCTGDPGGRVSCATDSTAALYETICGNRGYCFDLERGTWVCFDCVRRDYPRDDEGRFLSPWILDFEQLFHFTIAYNNGKPTVSETERGQMLLQAIERGILKVRSEEAPDSCVEGYFERFWKHLGESSTHQVRLSIQEQVNFTLN
jgi:hypothetical protein